jgi:hypothetical protein
MGFSASASWGEDDNWNLAGRYAGEFNGIKLSAAIAYVDATDDNNAPLGSEGAAAKARGGLKAQALQLGAYVQHVPTGLFVYGAYGKDYNDVTGALNGANRQQIDGDNFYIKAGLRTKLSPLGHTVFFGEYGENNDKMSNAQWAQGITSSKLEQWGLGVVQEIDAAAMSMWFVYRNMSAEETCGAAGGCVLGKKSFDDIDLFKVGALINF